MGKIINLQELYVNMWRDIIQDKIRESKKDKLLRRWNKSRIENKEIGE